MPVQNIFKFMCSCVIKDVTTYFSGDELGKKFVSCIQKNTVSL